MSKAEIIAELPKLSREELAEVQARLDELAGEVWNDDIDLSDAQKVALDTALAEYLRDPDAGEPWETVRNRIQLRLRP